MTTTDQVKFITSRYEKEIKVMASSGVRTREDTIAMLHAGVSRIATSSPFKIVESFS